MPPEYQDFIEDFQLSGRNYDLFVRLIHDPFVRRSDAALYSGIKTAIADAQDDEFEKTKPKPKK